MKRRRPQRAPTAWQSSAQFRAIRLEALERWNERRHLQAKCGARRKSDGDPCQQVSMANGRCYWHGGRTGTQEQWHRPIWPDGARPGAMTKLSRKLDGRDRAARKRARRIKKMTPEERTAHQEWQKTHAPGPPGPRAAARERRRQQNDVAGIFNRPVQATPVDPERQELADLAEALRRRIADLEKVHEPTAFD